MNTNNIILHSDGSKTAVHPHENGKFSLEQLQKYVGGYIEVINLTEDRVLIVNEDGKFAGHPFNEQATQLAHQCNAIFVRDFIVGDAVLIENKLLD